MTAIVQKLVKTGLEGSKMFPWSFVSQMTYFLFLPSTVVVKNHPVKNQTDS